MVRWDDWGWLGSPGRLCGQRPGRMVNVLMVGMLVGMDDMVVLER